MGKTIIDRIAPKGALRTLAEGQTPRVTPMELFFDLVYVFTIIQLSHYLLHHMSWLGALEAAALFATVWWAWNITAWACNWIDPDHGAGRAFMVVQMACALLMAVAAPEAFGERAWLFAGAYIAMALSRSVYMALLFRGERMGQNYAQLSVWNVLSGLFWIAGVLLPDYRLALWGCAVLVDYGGPYAGFWVPGLGMTPMETWPLRGLHLMERNELVFIIALGESILLLGGTLVSHPITAPTLLAAAIGFFMIVVLWWLYFAHAPSEGERAFHNADAHTRRARGGLAYANGVMVCGAVVMAVSIEMVLAHPLDAVHAQTVLVAVAGPVIFLVGGAMFHRSMAERIPLPGLVTMPILAAFGYAALVLHLSGLWLGAGVLAILIALARFSPRRTDPET